MFNVTLFYRRYDDIDSSFDECKVKSETFYNRSHVDAYIASTIETIEYMRGRTVKEGLFSCPSQRCYYICDKTGNKLGMLYIHTEELV